MARNARRGGGSSRARGRPRRGGFQPQSSSGAGTAALHQNYNPSAFSLRDEARNTERRPDFWLRDMKLRHNKINFVSSGSLVGTKVDEPAVDQEHDDPTNDAVTQSEDAMAQLNLGSTVNADTGSGQDHFVEKDPVAREVVTDAPLFYNDTTGDQSSIRTGLPKPNIRSSSPTTSSSSEEIVVFKGRTAIKTITDNIPTSRLESSQAAKRDVTQSNRVAKSRRGESATKVNSRDNTRRQRRDLDSPDPDEDAIADYLENLRAQDRDDPLASVYNTSNMTHRPLSLTDGNDWFDNHAAQQRDNQPTGSDIVQGDWQSSDLQDFDNISTSYDVEGAVARILRKRTRPSGVQYLVVYDDFNDDEARWIPCSFLTGADDLALVAAFDKEWAARSKDEDEDSNSESDLEDGSDDESDSEDEDEGEDEDFEDEKDLTRRKLDSMSDEAMARLLAKQEELGMGSHELLLFDDDDGDMDIDDLDNDFTTQNRRKSRRSRKPKDFFPSASLMADVLEQDPYNGFDVMDFDRPSLRTKPKGRPGVLPFELSDDDMESHQRTAWEADRSKKRLKKAEREALRAQGLLGKKNKFKPDLKVKYNEGMSVLQIQEEIRAFLNSPHNSRPFPPMDKKDRAVVHSIGSAFRLNSKSVGSGKQRFTTLIKTSRTTEYDEIAFDRVASGISRRFLPRMDRRGGGKTRGGGFGGGGSSRNAAVSYRDGEVVGATAPEIGSENRGRAMLEKMGWSSGTALGALNNKGILQPVAHVVKTTKSGLG